MPKANDKAQSAAQGRAGPGPATEVGAESPDFSRLVSVEELPADGCRFAFSATDAECRAVARRFGLVGIRRLETSGCLTPMPAGECLRLQAHVVADVDQSCVITLKPVAVQIDTEFERTYDPSMSDEWGDAGGEIILAEQDDVDREPLHGGHVDVAEAAMEQMGLELDPFPRSEGAVLANTGTDEGEPTDAAAKESPFAQLAALKDKLGGGR